MNDAIYDNDAWGRTVTVKNEIPEPEPLRNRELENSHSLYLVYDEKIQKLMDQTKTENVTNGGGARRKSKNVKRSRRKSRKSRKQRKSNKNRRTKYYKK